MPSLSATLTSGVDALKNSHAPPEHGRPPRLPHHSASVLLTSPLPGGTSNQHSVQPVDEILCRAILAVHGCVRYEEGSKHKEVGLRLTMGTATGFGAPFGIAGE